MVPVNLTAVATKRVMLHLFIRRDIHAVSLLKEPKGVIHDFGTFKIGWLVLFLVGFCGLKALGVPVSLGAGVGVLFTIAKKGHAINTGKVLRGAPWQIVIFSLSMYLVVY
jgi:arsenical pump membrane protein